METEGVHPPEKYSDFSKADNYPEERAALLLKTLLPRKGHKIYQGDDIVVDTNQDSIALPGNVGIAADISWTDILATSLLGQIKMTDKNSSRTETDAMAYGVLFRRHVENMSVPFRKEMSMADILANPEKTLLEWATSFANDGERNEKFEQMMTDAILEVKKQFDAAKNNNSGATPENAQAPQTLEDKFIAALKRKAGEELGKNMGNRFVGHVKYLAKLPTFEEAVDCFNWSRAFWLDLAKVFAQTDGGGNNTAIYAKMIVVALEEAKNSILGTKDAPLKVKKIDSPPVQNRGRDIDPFYAVASLPKPESRGIQAGASGSMRAPLPGGNGFVRPGANVPPVGSQASLSREPVVVGVDESPKIAQVPEVKNGIALTDMESKFVAYLQTCKQNYWNAPMYDEKTALEVVEYMRGKGVELGKTESLKVWQKVVGEYGNDVGSAVLKFYKTLAPADRPDVKKTLQTDWEAALTCFMYDRYRLQGAAKEAIGYFKTNGITEEHLISLDETRIYALVRGMPHQTGQRYYVNPEPGIMRLVRAIEYANKEERKRLGMPEVEYPLLDTKSTLKLDEIGSQKYHRRNPNQGQPTSQSSQGTGTSISIIASGNESSGTLRTLEILRQKQAAIDRSKIWRATHPAEAKKQDEQRRKHRR